VVGVVQVFFRLSRAMSAYPVGHLKRITVYQKPVVVVDHKLVGRLWGLSAAKPWAYWMQKGYSQKANQGALQTG
jgi:hypothetical protein